MMDTVDAAHRRDRLLRELGLQRYRLRSGAGAGRGARPEPSPAPVPASTGRTEPADADARLRVTVGVGAGHAPQGPHADIWRQVLAWLGLSEAEVEWCAGPGPEVVPLPPLADWLRPEGKRGLWLALKVKARRQ